MALPTAMQGVRVYVGKIPTDVDDRFMNLLLTVNCYILIQDF